MSMSRPLHNLVHDGSGIPRKMVAADGWIAELSPAALATVGAGTILAVMLTGSLIIRTGPVAAVIDTTDTAVNLQALYSNIAVGESIQALYSNQVGFAITIAGGTGVTMQTAAANNIVPANNSVHLVFVCTALTAGAPTFNCYVV